MRRIVIALLFLPTLSFAQTVNFTVKGKVGTLSAPAIIYLRYVNNGNTITDSTVLTNGNFRFRGEVGSPEKAMLLLNHTGTGRAQDGISFYIEKGIITINAADSLVHAAVKGGVLNNDLQKLNSALKNVTERTAALNIAYLAIPPEQRKEKDNITAFNTKFDEINAARKEIQKKFIQENPNSIISLEVLNSYGGYAPDFAEVGALYNTLSDAVKNSRAGKEYATKLGKVKTTSIGSYAPDFTQNDPSGKPVSLSSFRGKYVLIDFWASWCGPCRQENPNVVKAYEKYKDRNFTILGVSLDQPTGKEKWLKAIENDHLTWNHVSDLAYWKNAVAVQYGINAIPQNFLLDPTGKIIAKNIRGEQLQSTLASLFENTSAINSSSSQ
ncbi:MAG: redoxin domain-containing protein [Candidatus Dadabacteria bacterium]